MKIHTYIALSAIAWMGLTSCETRESLISDEVTMKEGYGALELLVTAKEPVETKAVSTTKFPVIIAEKSGEVVEQYTVGTLPSTILLPIGDYTVTAHSSAELEKRMESPYYKGTADLAIANGVTKQTTVTCTQQNSRVRLMYENDFLTTFKEWLVTIDDGSESVLVYTHEDGLSPRDVYYLFDKVKSIVVNVSAKTTTGETVAGNYRFTKADAPEGYEGDTEYFTGGDALVVKLTALSLEAPTVGNVSGIGVTLNISFANSSSSVIIPVEDMGTTGDVPGTGDGDNPSGGGSSTDGAVTMTFPANANYGTNGTGMPTSADVNIKTPKGLDKMIVKIKGGNAAFDAILLDLKMDGQSFLMSGDGVDVVDNADFQTLLNSFSLKAPKDGETEYNFPIGVFFTFLNATGATETGKAHEFYITVTDKEGNTSSGIYKVTIYQE